MFLLSDHGSEPDAETHPVEAHLRSIYDRLPTDGRVYLAIRGGNHFLFSDDSALLKSHVLMRALRLFGVVGIDGPRQLAITTYCVHSFFDAYLKGTGATPPRILTPTYPELHAVE